MELQFLYMILLVRMIVLQTLRGLIANDHQPVTGRQILLEEEWRTLAEDTALVENSYSITDHVRLVQVVG